MTMKQRAPGLPGSPGSNVQTGALPAAPADKASDTSKLAATADKAPEAKVADAKPAKRSEEHTSELQSLMRTSYAVFCLKKKTLQRQRRDTGHCPSGADHAANDHHHTTHAKQ